MLVLLLFNKQKAISFSDPDHFILLLFFKVYLEVLKLNSIKKELTAKIGLLGMYAVQQLIISSAPLAVKSLMGLQSTYVFTKQISVGGYASKQE